MSDNSRVRVSIVGVVIVALFASLLARLWFLQMGPEKALGQEAIALSTRTIQTQAPRGAIVDRYGRVLAQDRAAWAITIDRTLKKKVRTQVLGQLSELLGVQEPILQAAYDSPRQSPLEPAILAVDVPFDKRLAICRSASEDYPGVHVEELTVRSYPSGTIASQVLGYVGEIGPDQLKQSEAQGYQPGDLIGRDGVEAAYESVLRGRPRARHRAGRPHRQADRRADQRATGLRRRRGEADARHRRLQQAAEQALADGVHAAQTQQDQTVKSHYATLKAPGGAAVVLDAHDGSVLAMASYPTYPLSWWVGGINSKDFGYLNEPALRRPVAQSGHRRTVRAGVDLQARHIAGDDSLRDARPVHAVRRHRLGEDRQPHLRQRQQRPQRRRDAVERADGVERHVLLHDRQHVLADISVRRSGAGPRHPDKKRATSASARRRASRSTRTPGAFPIRRGRRTSPTRTTRPDGEAAEQHLVSGRRGASGGRPG